MNATQTSQDFLGFIRVNITNRNNNIDQINLKNSTILSDSSNWTFTDIMVGIFWGGFLGITVVVDGCLIGYTWVKCSDRASVIGQLIDHHDEQQKAKNTCKCRDIILDIAAAIIKYIQSRAISLSTKKIFNRLLGSESEELFNDFHHDYNDISLQI
jgi:hypothetical protein